MQAVKEAAIPVITLPSTNVLMFYILNLKAAATYSYPASPQTEDYVQLRSKEESEKA